MSGREIVSLRSSISRILRSSRSRISRNEPRKVNHPTRERCHDELSTSDFPRGDPDGPARVADDDLELIRWIGTEVEGGYLVREKDFQALDRELKQFRDHARKLVGKRLVEVGDRTITAYHASHNKRCRLLRGAQVSYFRWSRPS